VIPGAVLAAGRSVRMGRSKALLPCGPPGSDTFLRRIIRSMHDGGIEDILVIGRPDDASLMEAVLRPDVPARFVPNPDHDRGQLTSIVAAVNAVDHPGVRGLLIIPVDMPLVRSETFTALLRACAERPDTIVRATFQGRHGHPVIFDRGSFDALRHAQPIAGAKEVLHARPDRVLDVDVADEGVLKDVDSVEDYVAIFGRRPE
jgi:molybdenum cofactor cytidylyltransferase